MNNYLDLEYPAMSHASAAAVCAANVVSDKTETKAEWLSIDLLVAGDAVRAGIVFG